MATNIPPHNLGEVIDACIALIDDPALGIDDLINIMPGPDFPTGGIILGRQGIRSAYHLGRGSIVMRGKVAIDTIRKDREAIIISEIPYQVNKATMVERIAELVREKKIEGISRSARRIRPRRLSRRRRAEARRGGGRRAEPALSLHAAADEFRRQHGGARRRPSAGDEPEGPADALHRLPRTGRHPPHQIPAQQGARPRPYPGRPRDRGRQYRRDHPRDPHLARSEHRARHLDGARLAGQGRRGDDHADRRSAPPPQSPTAPRGCRWSRRRPFSICACSA